MQQQCKLWWSSSRLNVVTIAQCSSISTSKSIPTAVMESGPSFWCYVDLSSELCCSVSAVSSYSWMEQARLQLQFCRSTACSDARHF